MTASSSWASSRTVAGSDRAAFAAAAAAGRRRGEASTARNDGDPPSSSPRGGCGGGGGAKAEAMARLDRFDSVGLRKLMVGLCKCLYGMTSDILYHQFFLPEIIMFIFFSFFSP